MSDLNSDIEQPNADFLNQPLTKIGLDLEKTIYLIILLLALITRLWAVGDRVVSHDESLHTQYSFQYYNGDGYKHTPLMHGPSLFHITALSYWLFGDSDASSRIPVALIGSILVILPYFLRGWLGRFGALLASFLLLISPYITYYSRYIRHDIYIITAATILFIAILHYLRERKDKYIWWFAVAIALMFTTMETSFIYVAIFGSFLVIALVSKILAAGWFREIWPKIRVPFVITIIAVALFSFGFIGQHIVPSVLADSSLTTEVATDEGFAVDPNQELSADQAVSPEGASETLFRWLQIGSLFLLAGGLFFTANNIRPLLDDFPEFDLIVLFTTLTLPTATAFLVVLAGKDPLAYTVNTCELVGQETMSALQLFAARFSNATCRSGFLSSSVVLTGFFLVLMLVISLLVGFWWNRRRWLIAAAIFHGIFLLLFTSLFTNPSGWASGMVGSLGYWLAQQEVQRANQPWFFYFFVLPLYEFLPVIFSLIAAYYWAAKHRLNKILSYWLLTFLLAITAFSLLNWYYNQKSPTPESVTKAPGLIVAVIILAVALIYWVIVRRRQIINFYGLDKGLWELIDVNALFGLVPYLLWWFGLSWIIYGYAGEKMAWLSTHFIMPMVLLVGWYGNGKYQSSLKSEIRSRRFWLLTGLTALLLLAVMLALAPILFGQVKLGAQEAQNLTNLGRLLGSLLVTTIIVYFVYKIGRPLDSSTRRNGWIVAIFALLIILTIRFTYMSSFKNADYVTEYLVYAHGAPATKSEVLPQLESLSARLHGDESIQVAFDNDSSWPFTWYLRDYPNRIYFGENPGRNITEAPVVIVGSLNWGKVEPILGDDYEQRTYTFLWWPMEEYRNFSWASIFGDPDADPESKRGLGNPDVRKALWDIFFYRDFEKYSQVFGGNYAIGQWPLRHDLKMYIKKDALTTIWDHGLDSLAAEPAVDPYAEKEIFLSPSIVIGQTGSGQGELLQPRNIAFSPDGNIFVTDSGNHRIQVYDQFGNFLNTWGQFGSEPGQFNEPWGIAVDDNYVYVADTWNHRIQKFSHSGEYIASIGQSGTPDQGQIGEGLFFGPRDVVNMPEDRLLVTDTGNHRLQLFDTDGEFITAIGSLGSLPGQFSEPVGIALGSDDSIFVTDTWNGRIQRLAPDLLPLSEWPVDAWFGESINNKPYLALDQDDRIYVTDPEGYRVLMFDQNGQYLGRFGQYSLDTNGFSLPNGIAIGPDGRLYIADAGNNRILGFETPFNLDNTAQ